jgi:hypothetical protein
MSYKQFNKLWTAEVKAQRENDKRRGRKLKRKNGGNRNKLRRLECGKDARQF